MDLISIIIPAYNAEKYLRETLDSALAQTYPNYEVIVVDDGSTDGTNDILDEYGTRIRVAHQANGGSAAACNTGVAVAKGKWVCFLDADDIWLPNKLVVQAQHGGRYIISHTDSVCFGATLPQEVRRSSFEPLYAGQILDKLMIVNFITKSTVMMRRDVYNEYGGFDESYEACEDWPFWIKVCADHELGYIPEPLVRYRVHAKSKSMKSRRTLPARLRILEEAFSAGGVAHALAHLRPRSLASAYQVSCHFALEAGDWRYAYHCGLNALRYAPFVSSTWKNLVKASLMPFGYKY